MVQHVVHCEYNTLSFPFCWEETWWDVSCWFSVFVFSTAMIRAAAVAQRWTFYQHGRGATLAKMWWSPYWMMALRGTILIFLRTMYVLCTQNMDTVQKSKIFCNSVTSCVWLLTCGIIQYTSSLMVSCFLCLTYLHFLFVFYYFCRTI